LELLVAVATLGLAALLLVPVLRTDRGVLRERALNVMCQVRLRNLGVATMLYAGDYDGSLPATDAASIAAGSVHTSWSVYRLHRDYLGDAPGLTAAQWGDGQDAARNAYILGQARPAPFVCPVSIVHYTNAAPGNPFGEPIHYTYTPGINTANWWSGASAEPWIDLTVEMCQRAEARYGGRWGLWYDRVQPEAIYTNWEITRVATHHRRTVAVASAVSADRPDEPGRLGTGDATPAGGHAVWLDGAVSWRAFPDEWTPERVWRPRDALWLFADHPGNGVASLGAPPPWGRASLPIDGFLHPDPAARRTASQKLRALF